MGTDRDRRISSPTEQRSHRCYKCANVDFLEIVEMASHGRQRSKREWLLGPEYLCHHRLESCKSKIALTRRLILGIYGFQCESAHFIEEWYLLSLPKAYGGVETHLWRQPNPSIVISPDMCTGQSCPLEYLMR